MNMNKRIKKVGLLISLLVLLLMPGMVVKAEPETTVESPDVKISIIGDAAITPGSQIKYQIQLILLFHHH